VHEIEHKTPAMSKLLYRVGNGNVNEYVDDRPRPTQMLPMLESLQGGQASEPPPTRKALPET
jgi:hypothetical protein